MKKTSLTTLTECSIMIALSTALSLFKLIDLPAGGSITLASMAPMVVIAYRHGIKWGLGAATVAGVLQMLLGISAFSYVTTWQSVIAVALLDYIVAFSVYGLAGIFKSAVKGQCTAMVAGAGLSSLLRYLCHVISGCTVWAGLSIPTEAALVYSIGYNATYMIPDSIILMMVTAYLSMALDFRTQIPTRVKNDSLDHTSAICLLSAGGVILAGLVTDTVLVFSKLQGEDGGFSAEGFSAEGFSSVNWLAFGIVSAVTLIIAVALYEVIRIRKGKN